MKQNHQYQKIRPIFRFAAGFISALGIPTAILMIYSPARFFGTIGVIFNLYLFFFVALKGYAPFKHLNENIINKNQKDC